MYIQFSCFNCDFKNLNILVLLNISQTLKIRKTYKLYTGHIPQVLQIHTLHRFNFSSHFIITSLKIFFVYNKDLNYKIRKIIE